MKWQKNPKNNSDNIGTALLFFCFLDTGESVERQKKAPQRFKSSFPGRVVRRKRAGCAEEATAGTVVLIGWFLQTFINHPGG